MDGLYSLRDAADVLGVPEATVQRWVRSGLVPASERRGRRRLLTFQDLIAARAAKELFDRGVSERAVKRNLAALSASLPAVDRPLSRLRVVSDGERLVVIDDDVAYEPLSGQVVMDFVVGGLATRAAEVLALPRPADAAPGSAGGAESAWALFLAACALDEDGRPAEAEATFRRAVARDPQLAAAHTNLGNLAFRDGRRGEARARYEQALAIDPDQPEARYNLANLLDALGEPARAVDEWTRVCALAPDFADAHFNAGVAHARVGRTAAARAALERYLELDGGGEWAAAARALIENLARPSPGSRAAAATNEAAAASPANQ